MATSTITDEQGRTLATVAVSEYAPGRFEGTVLHADFPKELVVLLREYERLANEQVFPLLDESERKISAYKLFFAEKNAAISEVQLWGVDGIHFWVVDAGTSLAELTKQHMGRSLATAARR